MSEPANQIPPADLLAEIRDTIAMLKTREASLRALLLSDPSARAGNKFLAEIVSVTQTTTDLKEMRKMHADIVSEYTYERKVEKVELRAITEDGEITRRPKRRAS